MNATLRFPRVRSRSLGRHVVTGFLAASLLAAGCGGGSSTRRDLTQRERDSTLGRSVVPGAGAVTRALQESDRAGAAAHALDAQADSIAR